MFAAGGGDVNADATERTGAPSAFWKYFYHAQSMVIGVCR